MQTPKLTVIITIVIAIALGFVVGHNWPAKSGVEATVLTSSVARTPYAVSETLGPITKTFLKNTSDSISGANSAVRTTTYSDGTKMMTETKCSFTCGGGQQCSQTGCLPMTGGGCTDLDCVGEESCKGSCSGVTGGAIINKDGHDFRPVSSTMGPITKTVLQDIPGKISFVKSAIITTLYSDDSGNKIQVSGASNCSGSCTGTAGITSCGPTSGCDPYTLANVPGCTEMSCSTGCTPSCTKTSPVSSPVINLAQ